MANLRNVTTKEVLKEELAKFPYARKPYYRVGRIWVVFFKHFQKLTVLAPVPA